MTPIEKAIYNKAERILVRLLAPEAAKRVATEIAETAAEEVVHEIADGLLKLLSRRGRTRKVGATPAKEQSPMLTDEQVAQTEEATNDRYDRP